VGDRCQDQKRGNWTEGKTKYSGGPSGEKKDPAQHSPPAVLEQQRRPGFRVQAGKKPNILLGSKKVLTDDLTGNVRIVLLLEVPNMEA